MHRRFLLTILAVLAFGVATVPNAEAGGGGGKTKANAIYIVNAQAAVEPAQLVLWVPNGGVSPVGQSYAQLYARGAKLIAPGQTLKLFPNVAPGSGQVYVFNFQVAPALFPAAPVSAPYTVKSGTVLGYTIAGVDGAATITPIQ